VGSKADTTGSTLRETTGSLVYCAIVSVGGIAELTRKPSRDEFSCNPESIVPRTADHRNMCQEESTECTPLGESLFPSAVGKTAHSVQCRA
jgi:hypothetical protein